MEGSFASATKLLVLTPFNVERYLEVVNNSSGWEWPFWNRAECSRGAAGGALVPLDEAL